MVLQKTSCTHYQYVRYEKCKIIYIQISYASLLNCIIESKGEMKFYVQVRAAMR